MEDRSKPKKINGWFFRPFVLLFVVFFLCGCVTLQDPEASQEYSGDVVATLNQGHTIGQTATSRRPNLNGIQLYLRQTEKPGTPNASLTFEVYHSPGDSHPAVVKSIPYRAFQNAFPLTITFPSQNDPPGQNYYFVLKTNGGPVSANGRLEDAYPAGQLFIDGSPKGADLAFRLSYDYGPAAMASDLRKALGNLWLILPLALVLWVPGRLLLSFIESRLQAEGQKHLDWGERTALSVGLSLAAIPVAMLWTTTLGLHWSRAGVYIAFGLLAAVYLVRMGLKLKSAGGLSSITIKPGWHGIALLAVFLFSLALRLAMVRDMAGPAWIDSVHHATITRLIMEQGIIPHSYSPYVELVSAGYHPGFHMVLAAFLWLSGLDVSSGMLLFGQVLNALCVLAVYLFTTTFTGNRTAGVAASLITGAFTLMPAYYASWGRYTQLDGLLILAACMALVKYLLEKRGGIELLLVTSICCGGLFLAHYRVIAFLACLLAAYLIAWSLESLAHGAFKKNVSWAVGSLAATAALSILLTLPWWPVFFRSMVTPILGETPAPGRLFGDFSWGYLLPSYGKSLLILAGLGLAWSILRARWFGLTLALWFSFLFLLANPGKIPMPGGGLNNTSVEIMLFIPISILGGYLVGSAIEAGGKLFTSPLRIPYYALIGIAGALLALLGARTLLPILNPITMLIREADKPALAWIQENIPQNESILINPFLWGYGIYAGQDGGYWLGPLGGHKTLPPPVLYYMAGPKVTSQINDISRQVIADSKDPVRLAALMQAQGLHYIFIGARGGVLSARTLQESPLFDLIYNQNGTWLFELKQAASK